ncbi:hypothetical protein [Bacillus sp. YC2]|uniref:hypothetical protein n=1 Tax=Bacillus sp. YC2 TaxID=2861287 RepID=UPI00223BA31F|nr:hypothetical protein [Bacillus sp. YC2]
MKQTLLFRHSHVLTGGTAGLSLSLTYLFYSSFSILCILSHRNGRGFYDIHRVCRDDADFVYGACHWLPTFSFSPLPERFAEDD